MESLEKEEDFWEIFVLFNELSPIPWFVLILAKNPPVIWENWHYHFRPILAIHVTEILKH